MAAQQLEQPLLNHERVRKSTELPLFYGRKDKDVIDPHDFLKRFETASEIARWVPVPAAGAAPDYARKCQEFYMLLRDKALDWYRSLADIPDFNYNSWDALKTEFIATYAPRYTARTACLSFGDLVQRTGEGVTDFYLRVSRAYHLLKETRPPALFDVRRPRCAADQAEQAVREAAIDEANVHVKREGIEDMGRYMIQQLFTAGLHEDIRIKTMEANEATLTEAYKRALNFETILKDKRGSKPLVSSIAKEEENDLDEDDEELLEQVNAIRFRRGKKPLRFASHKTGNPANTGKLTINCRYCKKPGHFQRECIKRKRDRKPMVDQHGKPYRVSSLNHEDEEEQEQPEDGNNLPEEEGAEGGINSIRASDFYGINCITAVDESERPETEKGQSSDSEEEELWLPTIIPDREEDQKLPSIQDLIHQVSATTLEGKCSQCTCQFTDPILIDPDCKCVCEPKNWTRRAFVVKRKPVFSGNPDPAVVYLPLSEPTWSDSDTDSEIEGVEERVITPSGNAYPVWGPKSNAPWTGPGPWIGSGQGYSREQFGAVYAISATDQLMLEEENEVAGQFDKVDDPDVTYVTRELRAKWFSETSDKESLNY